MEPRDRSTKPYSGCVISCEGVLGGRTAIILPAHNDEFLEVARNMEKGYKFRTPFMRPSKMSIPSSLVPAVNKIGRHALDQGLVAIVTPMGGRSTRYGGTFRGDVSLEPTIDRTIFELQGRRIAWTSQLCGGRLIWIIMASRYTESIIRHRLAEFGQFGISQSNIVILRQPLYTVLTDRGVPASDADGNSVLTPGGHGALSTALSGKLGDDLRQNGIRYLVLFNYSNVLERVCDLSMLGWHIHSDADVTVKGVTAHGLYEQAGRIGSAAGRYKVIEYYYLSEILFTEDSDLYPIWTGSAVVSLRGDYLNTGLSWHRVRHNEPGDPRILWRAEQFIHELLDHADRAGLIWSIREQEYAAVKSRVGINSLESARRQLKAELVRCAMTALRDDDVRRADLMCQAS